MATAWSPESSHGGSSGSGGGARVLGPFSFTFATAGLNTGVQFYTPTVGDYLLDAWVEIDTAFNGTTPTADIGTTAQADSSGIMGSNAGVWWDLSVADKDYEGAALPGNGVQVNYGHNAPRGNGSIGLNNAAVGDTDRSVPAKFASASPLIFWASQNGAKGGAAVGGTAGACKVFLHVATPVAA